MTKAGQPESLASLWALATTRSLHGPFCTCAGVGPLKLSPRELEQQILDFLADKYRDELAVVQALARRRCAQQGSFVQWLEGGVRDGNLRPDLIASVRNDVVSVCASIVDPQGEFKCT
jgi:hypothetical protein